MSCIDALPGIALSPLIGNIIPAAFSIALLEGGHLCENLIALWLEGGGLM
jgi:hypothetical protein